MDKNQKIKITTVANGFHIETYHSCSSGETVVFETKANLLKYLDEHFDNAIKAKNTITEPDE